MCAINKNIQECFAIFIKYWYFLSRTDHRIIITIIIYKRKLNVYNWRVTVFSVVTVIFFVNV